MRAKLSYLGKKVRGFVPLVFFLSHDRYDRGKDKTLLPKIIFGTLA